VCVGGGASDGVMDDHNIGQEEEGGRGKREIGGRKGRERKKVSMVRSPQAALFSNSDGLTDPFSL